MSVIFRSSDSSTFKLANNVFGPNAIIYNDEIFVAVINTMKCQILKALYNFVDMQEYYNTSSGYATEYFYECIDLFFETYNLIDNDNYCLSLKYLDDGVIRGSFMYNTKQLFNNLCKNNDNKYLNAFNCLFIKGLYTFLLSDENCGSYTPDECNDMCKLFDAVNKYGCDEKLHSNIYDKYDQEFNLYSIFKNAYEKNITLEYYYDGEYLNAIN